MNARFDVVVVGGGTAGCVVAARLSEDLDRSVLLLEAGHDYATHESIPEAVRDGRYVPMRGHADVSRIDPDHDWGLNAEAQNGEAISVPQGRLIGGGSAINGMICLRGATADYREWADLGSPNWDWEHVLPAFRAVEDDAAPGSDIHGRGGAFPLARAHRQEYARLQAAFVETCRRLGVEECWDLNAPDAHGVGPVPMNRMATTRLSTAMTHLAPARHRENLTVSGDILVDRIVFEGAFAVGVRLADRTLVEAETVVLCAGAILTPAILQRSGVGPPELLGPLGVPVVADLPVGKNLFDHFSVPLLSAPKPGAWSPDDFSLQAALRTSTSLQPGSLDAQLTMFSYLNVKTTGINARGLAGGSAEGLDHVVGLGAVLNKPRSSGTVRITSTDASVLPQVKPNYLDKQIDRDAIREIVRLGWTVMTSQPLASLLGTPFNFDKATVADDKALDAVIEQVTASGYHFTGTCAMGSRDRGGVVDEAGLVHGVRGLRVADASVIPVVTAANTMLPTVMTAERLAAAARGRQFPDVA